MDQSAESQVRRKLRLYTSRKQQQAAGFVRDCGQLRLYVLSVIKGLIGALMSRTTPRARGLRSGSHMLGAWVPEVTSVDI